MVRRPWIEVEGGLYHVYNRFARGAELFSEVETVTLSDAKARLLRLLADVVDLGDGVVITRSG